jgi:hypothetical protein
LRRTVFIVKTCYFAPSIVLLFLAALGTARLAPAAGPAIKLSDDKGTAVDVTGLSANELAALAKFGAKAEEWTPVFALFVERADGKDHKDQPALVGDYRIEGEVLRFTPRYPLARGVKYRAVLDLARIPARAGSTEKPVEVVLLLPKKETPPTVVERVYPTADTLPENQLRFYLHFSAPMSRGEAYRHVRLLNANGKEIKEAFLELDQELWDARQQRFTLIIEPGRIKSGLRPREELGPVLEKGKSYTLVIDRAWRDAEGQPLKETFRKTFRAMAPVEERLDAKTWKLTAPPAGTRAPLVVNFPKPLDYALLHRMVTVEDAKGKLVDGAIEVTDKETCWRFTPKEVWPAGTFHLAADTRLEDLAGNNLARSFEVDVFRPVQSEIKTEKVKLPFEVKASE